MLPRRTFGASLVRTRPGAVNLYHTTTEAAAREIELYGFREPVGDAHGIYFADRPLGRDDVGPLAAVIFKISIADAELKDLVQLEVCRDDVAYHEWLVPAELANHIVCDRLPIESRIAAFEPGQPTIDGKVR